MSEDQNSGVLEPPRALFSSQPLQWLRFFGPGAVIGNTIFGSPLDATTWTFGIPSIWAWQILWWVIGVVMMWFLAYKLEMSTVPTRDVEALHEDIGDVELALDKQ